MTSIRKPPVSGTPAAAKMPASLVRGLTLLPAAAIIVTNVIGTGVFVKARVMTCNVGAPWMVYWRSEWRASLRSLAPSRSPN